MANTLPLAGVVSLAFIALLPGSAPAQTGLDPTFGNGGLLEVRNSGGYGDVRIYDGGPHRGEIVAMGSMPRGNRNFLVRLNSDGSRDRSFGRRGVVMLPRVGISDFELQLKGSVVYAAVDGRSVTARRISADGTADRSFGRDGEIELHNFSGALMDGGTADVEVQPATGRLIVNLSVRRQTGPVGPGVSVVAELRAFDPDGLRDRSWSGDGRALVDFGAGARSPSGMVFGDDGSLWAAGCDEGQIGVQRFQADGNPDPALTPGTDAGATYPEVGAACPKIALEPGESNQPVIGVRVHGDGEPSSLELRRIADDGTLVPGFPAAGAYVSGDFNVLFDLAIDEQGRITALLRKWNTGPSVLVRFLPDGAIDGGFGEAGRVSIKWPDAEFSFGGLEVFGSTELVAGAVKTRRGRAGQSALGLARLADLEP